jgi:hypothetical protein
MSRSRRRRLSWSLVATVAVATFALLAIPQAQANHIETAGGGFGHDNTIPDGFGTGNLCNVNDGCFIANNVETEPQAVGLLGIHSSTTGACCPSDVYHSAGVVGQTASPNNGAAGVYGDVTASSPGTFSAGIRGDNNAVYGYGVFGTNGYYGPGVYGQSSGGIGVEGLHYTGDNADPGVWGVTNSGTADALGVKGTASAGIGVFGSHTGANGVSPGLKGDTNSTDVNAVGVLGRVVPTSAGAGSAAVRGINNGTGSTGIGVWGSEAGAGTGVYGSSSNGIGVRASSTNVALQVNGKAKFSRSGSITIAAGTASKAVSLAGVSSNSMVIATAQQNAGVYVKAAVPASGAFTIYLTGNAPGTGLKVAYFVLN